MEQPTCYEVYRTPTGWHARLDGLDEPILFITREHALKIAHAAALDRWLLDGCPSRVTVSDEDGRIVDDVRYDEHHDYDQHHNEEWLGDPDLDAPELRMEEPVKSVPSSATKLSMRAVVATA